jgi:hypothetical protein
MAIVALPVQNVWVEGMFAEICTRLGLLGNIAVTGPQGPSHNVPVPEIVTN